MEKVKQKLVPSGDLSQRSVTSGVWSASGNVVARLLQLTKVIVLTHFLSPTEFGLVGIAMIAIVGFRRLSHLGLDSALIHHRDDDIHDYLDSVWISKVLRGGIIAVVTWIVAPSIGSVFGSPRVVPVLRVLGLGQIFFGLKNPALVYFKKDLEFHKQFAYRVITSATNVTVAVIAAIILGNVWALVFGSLAGNIAQVVASYALHSYRPSIKFDISKFLDLFEYGKWLTVSAPIRFLITQGDDAFVGWFLGAGPLGIYRVSYRFSNAPATEISSVINQVLFPTYAKIQDDSERTADWYGRALTLAAFITFPMAFGIVAVSPAFVKGFLSAEWGKMAPVMQILAFYGLIRSIGAIDGALVRGIGRPELSTLTHVLTLIFMAVSIFPASAKYGLIGTAIAVSGSLLLATLTRTAIVLRLIEFSVGDWLSANIFPALNSLAMMAIVIGVPIIIPIPSTYLLFGVQVATGVITYGAFTLITIRVFDYEITSLARRMWTAVSSNTTTEES
jgi:O-antigen/teichoic acid export membrane protein